MPPFTTSLRRTGIATAVTLSAVSLGAAFHAPSASAESSTGWNIQACQYSFDQYWRQVPVEIVGTLVYADGPSAGTEVPTGTSLAPGTKVRLDGATVDAILPDWIKTFATEGGFIPLGEGEIPLDGWIALEGVNTKEGVTAPIPFSSRVRTSIVNGSGGTVDEQASILDVIPAPITAPTWTVAGGTLNVRQAIATAMGEVPEGRDGSLIKVNGSLFVRATLGAGSTSISQLFIDCLHGDQVPLNVGASHSDALPTPLRADVRVAGFAGAVDGVALPTAVDAEVTTSALPRANAGIATPLTGSKLTLRLSSAQSTAWLGTSGSAQISGSVPLLGTGTTVTSQSAATVPQTVSAIGSATTVELPLESTTWTPVGTTGAAVRTGDAISLTARVGGVDRVLTLDRDTSVRAAGDAYPFAQILGPDPRTRFDGDGTVSTVDTNNPPALDGPKTFAPPPVATKRTTVKVASTSLKRSKGKVKVRLTNLSKTATTSGKFRLVTMSKYRVGKSRKKRTITLVASKSFSLKKARSVTYAVKLSKDATALLKTRKSVKARLTVTPTSTKTQKTVTKTLTVKR